MAGREENQGPHMDEDLHVLSYLIQTVGSTRNIMKYPRSPRNQGSENSGESMQSTQVAHNSNPVLLTPELMLNLVKYQTKEEENMALI